MHFEIFAWQILLSILVDFQMSFGWTELKEITKKATQKLYNVFFLQRIHFDPTAPVPHVIHI